MATSTDSAALLRDLALRAIDLTRSTTGARLAWQAAAQRVDPAALPPQVRDRVAARLAAVPEVEPLAWRDVERLLRDAWGAAPGTVLEDIGREPEAVRPASQVHRAVTAGGDGVAVKVLRPGVAQALRGELGLVDAVAAMAGGVLPGLDAPAIAREVRERLLDELDLDYEGGVQRGFHRALRRHPDLGVPGVHSDLTHETVLVSDWVEGTPAAELAGADRDRAAQLLMRFHLGAAVSGTVHADPDPRDALLDAGGRLWVLDFGASRRVEPGRVRLAAAAADALLGGDEDRLASLVADIGWLGAEDARSGAAAGRRILGELLEGPARIDEPVLARLVDRALQEQATLIGLALRARVPPQDLWPLRMLGGLGGVLAELGAEGDWPALTREVLAQGW